MKEFLFVILNFLDFWFFPLIIALVVAIIVEQVVRRFADSDPQSAEDARSISIAMRVRKFIWTQNVILNTTWLICYFVFMFMMRTAPPTEGLGDPNLLWQL